MACMSYREYKEVLKYRIQEQLGETAEVYFSEVAKNNVKKEAIVIDTVGEPFALQIHLDSFYREYEEKQDLTQNVDSILLLYGRRKEVPADWDFVHWEKIKQNVRIRLVRFAGNEEYLKDKIYKQVLDMAMIFTVVLEGGNEGEAYMAVTREHLKMWHISMEAVCMTAIENLKKEEFVIEDMYSFLPPEIADGLEKCPLFVFSSRNRMYGARAMLRKDMLKAFAEEQRSNLFILPSSVHETLLLRDEKGIEAEYLKGMVCTINVNANVIAKEDVLSDSIYYYDREKNELKIAL